MSADFGHEIDRLAEEARGESLRLRGSGAASSRRRVSRIIWLGIALIGLELVSLAVLHGMRMRQISDRDYRPTPLASRNDCRGEIFRSYRKIVTYMRDHERRPPATLADLLGTDADKLPSDPVTGRTLLYSTDGRTFTLGCPEA